MPLVQIPRRARIQPHGALAAADARRVAVAIQAEAAMVEDTASALAITILISSLRPGQAPPSEIRALFFDVTCNFT
jgi:hypothetical protein